MSDEGVFVVEYFGKRRGEGELLPPADIRNYSGGVCFLDGTSHRGHRNPE